MRNSSVELPAAPEVRKQCILHLHNLRGPPRFLTGRVAAPLQGQDRLTVSVYLALLLVVLPSVKGRTIAVLVWFVRPRHLILLKPHPPIPGSKAFNALVILRARSKLLLGTAGSLEGSLLGFWSEVSPPRVYVYCCVDYVTRFNYALLKCVLSLHEP
jgi:hypothetical protein